MGVTVSAGERMADEQRKGNAPIGSFAGRSPLRIGAPIRAFTGCLAVRTVGRFGALCGTGLAGRRVAPVRSREPGARSQEPGARSQEPPADVKILEATCASAEAPPFRRPGAQPGPHENGMRTIAEAPPANGLPMSLETKMDRKISIRWWSASIKMDGMC
jgi:hypothetical protein